MGAASGTPPSDPNYDLERHRAILEDIKDHREFVQKLYARMAASFFAGLLIFGGITVFVFDKSVQKAVSAFGIDDKLYSSLEKKFENKINEAENRFNDSTQSALNTARKAYRRQLEITLKTAISNASEQIVNTSLSISEPNIRSLVQNIANKEVSNAVAQVKNFDFAKYLERAALPEGVVVAFDGSCPEELGWRPFLEATSRAIIGAVPEGGMGSVPRQYAVDAQGSELQAFNHGAIGGLKEVTLKIGEMPNHTHSMKWRNRWMEAGQRRDVRVMMEMDQQNPDDQGPTAGKGGGAPHENMPPFLALTFCKKVRTADSTSGGGD